MSIEQRMNKSNFSLRFPLILGIVLLCYNEMAYGQYILPKAAILVQHNIHAVHVSKTPLRVVNGKGKDITDSTFDKTTQKLRTYFVNSNGRVDSVYYYGRDTTIYHKHIFRHTLDDQIVEITKTNQKGEIVERKLLEELLNKEWRLRTWQLGVLQYEVKITADSIIYETIMYNVGSPHSYRNTSTWDLQNDIKSESYYDGNEIVTQRTYQWISENDIPTAFIYAEYRRAEGQNESSASAKAMATRGITETKKYTVAADGSVNTKDKGLFTDPFHMHNYFEQREYFKGIENPTKPLFRGDSLIYKRADSDMLKFDGTNMEYEYNFRYE
jgi:hypothetical protein